MLILDPKTLATLAIAPAPRPHPQIASDMAESILASVTTAAGESATASTGGIDHPPNFHLRLPPVRPIS
jgi:hypothetical protein